MEHLTFNWLQTITTILTLGLIGLGLVAGMYRHFDRRMSIGADVDSELMASVARIEEHLLTLNGRVEKIEEKQTENDKEQLAFYKVPPWTEPLQILRDSILRKMEDKHLQTEKLFADCQTYHAGLHGPDKG